MRQGDTCGLREPPPLTGFEGTQIVGRAFLQMGIAMDRRKILLVLAALIAALGTMLVWLYVQGAEDRAEEDRAAVSVLVATQSIAQGESFSDASSAGKFEEAEIPKDALLPGALTSLDALEGKVALVPIYDGEQLLAAKWGGSADVDVTAKVLAIPKGKMAVTVQLTDPQRVAGFVKPGSEVSVIVVVSPPEGPTYYTRTLVRSATVLGVGDTSTIVTQTKTTKEGESTTDAIPQTLLTLALDQVDAERVVWGTSHGELHLALVNDKTDLGPTQQVDEPRLFQ